MELALVFGTHLAVPLPAGHPTDASIRFEIDGKPYEVRRAFTTIDSKEADWLTVDVQQPVESFFAKRRHVDVRVGTMARSLPGYPRPIFNPKRRPNILVMIPAGMRTGRDDVVHEADWPFEQTIEQYVNTGDWVVYDSMLKMLEFANVRIAHITDPTPDRIQEYNSNYEFCVIRGSNFIRNGMEWFQASSLLRQLKIPVIAFGVGAQAARRDRIVLDAEQRLFWNLVAERSNSIGVRGAFSASVLQDNGIGSAEIVGCPSIFRARNPNLNIPNVDLSRVRNIGFNLRREVGPDYARDVKSYLAIQKKIIHELLPRFSVTMTSHGEQEEKAIALNVEPYRSKALAALLREKWFESVADPLYKTYQEKLTYCMSVKEYEELVRSFDLVMGLRVHGNLPALANGVPAAFLEYDTRSGELAETFSIPQASLESFHNQPIISWLERLDYSAFNRNFRARYEAMATFLERNGLPHRMWAVRNLDHEPASPSAGGA